MALILPSMLALLAAALLFFCVRYATAMRRTLLAAGSLGCLLLSFFFGTAFGGFWAEFYAVVTIFMLSCVTLPWIDFLWRRRAR